jgi:diphosphate-dependent phosphofructokinase
MCALQGLTQPSHTWQVSAIPLTALMHLRLRSGKEHAVIEKGLVDLNGAAFKHFKKQRKAWALEDAYRFPGPIQFFGPSSNSVPHILQLETNE